MNPSFWTFNVGQVITAVGLLVSFWMAHNANVRRAASYEAKVNLMYEWWCTHVYGGKGNRRLQGGD